MATKVRTISINFNAGTTKFLSDVDTASAKIKQFGTHGVSSMQATSGAIRELEGNFTNNIRAVERFLATTLHLGPALQAAFPLVGGIAFGGMLVEMGEKVYKFFKSIQEAPERIAGAFRDLSNSQRLTKHKPSKKDLGTVEAHPFMRPAAEASADTAVEAFTEGVMAELAQAQIVDSEAA